MGTRGRHRATSLKRRRTSRHWALPLALSLSLVTSVAWADDGVPTTEPATETTTTTLPAETTTTTTPAPVETATLIVKLRFGLTLAEQADVIARNGGTETSSIAVLRLHMVEVTSATFEVSKASFIADPDVVSVDIDRVRIAEATPSDPSYGDQWALPQIGWDTVFGYVVPSGSATIAVFDTGVDPGADLTLVSGWSAFGADTSDVNGHGTSVASIAAATTDNGAGIAGVAYAGVSIMPVKVLADDGTGQDSDIITGLVWAVDNGADVVLMAFSNPGESAALQFAVDYAWANGVVLVASAGNDGSTAPTYPAGLAKVVGVGATDQADEVWAGSNQSAAVFMVAPGVGIASSIGTVTGTSASAAMVAGAAAVMQANDPGASPSVIVGRLARNAEAVAGVAGNGRLHLGRALIDESTEGVTPAGAPGGGPVVGPYVAAGNGTVNGTVTEAVTADPISSATVTCTAGCTGPANSQSATTAANGMYGHQFEFPGNATVPNPKTIQLTASKTGCTSSTQSVSFTANTQTVTSNFSLTCGAPDLTATKTNDVSGTVVLGNNFQWNIRFENEGNATATFVLGQTLLTDNLPSGPTYGSTTVTTSGTGGTGTISCSITSDNLSCTASGASGTSVTMLAGSFFDVSFDVTPSAAGTLDNPRPGVGYVCQADPNNVVAESNQTNNDCSDSVVVVDPDLTATKTNNASGSVAINETFTWSIEVENEGSTTATFADGQKVLKDELRITGATYGGATVSPATPNLSCAINVTTKVLECVASGGSVVLASGASFTVSFDVTPSSAGTLTNPKSGGVCGADPDNSIAESDETNNDCADDLTVNLRGTSTEVTCTPNPVVVNQTTTCTATVTDTAAGTASDPAGTVEFDSDGSGDFSAGTGTFDAGPPPNCTLVASAGPEDESSCSVTYEPTAAGTGTHNIDADYVADTAADTHADSSDPNGYDLTVNLRPTTTTVDCDPEVVALGSSSTCTVTVTDIEDAGAKSPPTGNVSFATSGTGTFTPAQCSLTPNPDGDQQQLLSRLQLECRQCRHDYGQLRR